jgi:hypothetical protein
MTLWATECCTQDVFMGKKRERFCDHGRPFQKVRDGDQEAPQPRRRSLSSNEPKRDWTDARAKAEEEGCCRICKTKARKIEAAHVLGREHDEPKVNKATGEALKELHVHPDRIVPLCGPFPEGCHGDVDYNRVNLVHYLTIDEQVQAVRDAGGIAPAFTALAPVGPEAVAS